MKTGTGYLQQWTVVNAPEDDPKVKRCIVAHFVVMQGSAVSLAVAALSGEPARLSAGTKLEASQSIMEVPCTVNPPWGAKKNGGFEFKAVMEYTPELVKDMLKITHGMALTVGLDVVQDELEVDPQRAEVMEFVSG